MGWLAACHLKAVSLHDDFKSRLGWIRVFFSLIRTIPALGFVLVMPDSARLSVPCLSTTLYSLDSLRVLLVGAKTESHLGVQAMPLGRLGT